MPLVYAFTSSRMEARPIEALTHKGLVGKNRRSGRVESAENELVLFVTGIGAERARIKANEVLGAAGSSGGPPPGLPEYVNPESAVGATSAAIHEAEALPPKIQRPDAVLSVGICGGLTEVLPESSIVIYTECLSVIKPVPVRSSPAFTSAIVTTLQSRGIACAEVIGITSPRVATTKSEKLALGRAGASVVDMESYEILSAAERVGTPAAVLRVISDSPGRPMPNFNGALNDRGELDYWKAMWIAVGSPLQTVRLIAAAKRAMKRLAPAFKVLLESNCFQLGTCPLKK